MLLHTSAVHSPTGGAAVVVRITPDADDLLMSSSPSSVIAFTVGVAETRLFDRLDPCQISLLDRPLNANTLPLLPVRRMDGCAPEAALSLRWQPLEGATLVSCVFPDFSRGSSEHEIPIAVTSKSCGRRRHFLPARSTADDLSRPTLWHMYVLSAFLMSETLRVYQMSTVSRSRRRTCCGYYVTTRINNSTEVII